MAIALPLLLTLAATAAPVPPRSPLRAELFPRADVRLLDGPFLDAQRRDTAYLLQTRSGPTAAHLPCERRPAHDSAAARRMGGAGGRAAGPHARPLPDRLRADVRGHGRRAPESSGRWRSWPSWPRAAGPRERAARTPAISRPSPRPSSIGSRARENVWAPYYTLHKILAGLLDVHRVTGRSDLPRDSRAASPAGWRSAPRASARPSGRPCSTASSAGCRRRSTELLPPTRATRGSSVLARRFDHRAVFDPLARGEDRLDGLHANTQIPRPSARPSTAS